MKKWILLGMSVLGILSLSAFSDKKTSILKNNQSKNHNDITAVINKNTTAKELEDLTAFFAESGIELTIKKVEYNDTNEITSLNLVLSKGGSKSNYSSSSNQPISELELGFKNGNLYITNSGIFDISSWKNQISFAHKNTNVDSILKKQKKSFNFDIKKDGDSIFFNGKHFDVQKFSDQITGIFNFDEDEDEDGLFIINGQKFPHSIKNSKKFSFIDDPDIEKLIIIDGKESNFKELDKLAKSDKLDTVDFLKSKTAMSIYGDKAKDGAIIATTKK